MSHDSKVDWLERERHKCHLSQIQAEPGQSTSSNTPSKMLAQPLGGEQRREQVIPPLLTGHRLKSSLNSPVAEDSGQTRPPPLNLLLSCFDSI